MFIAVATRLLSRALEIRHYTMIMGEWGTDIESTIEQAPEGAVGVDSCVCLSSPY